MHPEIITIPSKKLIGKRLKMSFANNNTPELFRSFMPERRLIKNTIGNNIFCVQLYQNIDGFDDLKQDMEFEKWAAMEVSDFNYVPEGMECYTLTGGLYAVFHYKGSSTNISIFEYIFKAWLPHSSYALDQRDHFEILGDKYKNNDPNSEEDIWVPVRLKV